MRDYIYKERTERKLPHYHPLGATLFVTFRLAESVPRAVLRLYDAQKKWLSEETGRVSRLRLRSDSPELVAHEQRLRDFRRHWFVKFEDSLHRAVSGPTWLKDRRLAGIVAEALPHRDGQAYRLDAYCIMSNHVHAVFMPFLSTAELREEQSPEGLRFISRNPPLDAIMKSLKGWTAWSCNRALGRKVTFWEDESYDHAVRNDAEFERVVRYTLSNPVKAGLVREWQDWLWSYRRARVPQAF